MVFLYDLLFLCIALVYLPVYALKRKFHKDFRQRFGNISVNFQERPIWIHAVSVGEMKACEQLIATLRSLYPQSHLAISTVTTTGNKIARNIAKEGDFVFYLPLDFSFMVRRSVNKLNPALFIIAETEIWPNLISYLYKKNTPIITVNARISDSSFKGYRMIKPLIGHILRKVRLFCVQSEIDERRLIFLGVDKEKIKITGNMKYDSVDCDKTDYAHFRKKLNLAQKDRLLVAGSTHAGEEDTILKIYKELSARYPGLRLLIAPRHPERSNEVESLIRKYGFKICRISRLNENNDTNEINELSERVIFLLDTIGQLTSFYAISDIVFIGGSLIKKGGHNILEPAFFGKPVLMGTHMFNFRDIAAVFMDAKAAIMVKNADELKEKIIFLLKNNQEAAKVGERARELFMLNQGASPRNMECIAEIFKEVKYESGN